MNGGTGDLSAKMYMDDKGKIIPYRLSVGSSIGIHKHPISDDLNSILSGTRKAVCDGIEETLVSGGGNICKKGSEHSIVNTGTEDLVMLTIVAER